MSERHATSPERRWRFWATFGVLAALVTGAVLGFIVLPVVQGAAAGIDAYTAICRAFGVLPGSPARITPTSTASAQPVTQVAWTAGTFAEIYHADRTNGERIAAERCVACHTVDGKSPDPSIPRNNGQSAFTIYKQLHDFKNGSRAIDVMAGQVQDLDDRAMADLAVYYGNLYRGDLMDPQNAPYVSVQIEQLVARGDSTRGLPPCAACHGARAGGPIETPTLTAQYSEYLEAQLKAFASGTRHNDIYHRMRSVARVLKEEEIKLLALYYSGAQMPH